MWGGGRFPRRIAVVLAAGAIAGAGAAPAATAATSLGQTFTPLTVSCTADFTFAQTTSPPGFPSYRIPSDGVITSWSYFNTAAPHSARLKIMRRVGTTNMFFVVGQSAQETSPSSSAGSFATRITVRAGDVLGYHRPTSTPCHRDGSAAGYQDFAIAGNPAPGATVSMAGPFTRQLNVSAVLEPDGDADGFGDETQDACPTDPSTQGSCPDTSPPDTRITQGPKDKTKKKQATFEFSGSDARAVAGFQCSLDGGDFAACTSPHTVKVKKGKHTFSVHAADAAGNVDAAPATDDWKVKRKRRK